MKGFINGKNRTTKPRIIMSVVAREKQGKTHFALTAPGSIADFSTDIGEEGVIDKFVGDKDIWIMPVDKIDDDAPEQAKDQFETMKDAYFTQLKSDKCRTIIMDTATEIWEVCRMARFGRVTNVPPLAYGPVNAEYRSFIREAYNYDKNVILLHKMKKQYVGKGKDASWNGEYERAGFAETGHLVQVNAVMLRDDDEEVENMFGIRIVDCRQNPALNGQEFWGAMCSFPIIASMVLPNVDPSMWE